MNEYMLRYLKASSNAEYLKKNHSVFRMIEEDLKDNSHVDSEELKQIKSRLRDDLLKKQDKSHLKSIKE
jgi:hypothetical protein